MEILYKGDMIRKYGKMKYSTGLTSQFTTERRKGNDKPFFCSETLFRSTVWDRHFKEGKQ